MTLEVLQQRWRPVLASPKKATKRQLNNFQKDIKAYKALNPYWKETITS